MKLGTTVLFFALCLGTADTANAVAGPVATWTSFSYSVSAPMISQAANIQLNFVTGEVTYTENPGRCMGDCPGGSTYPAQSWQGTLPIDLAAGVQQALAQRLKDPSVTNVEDAGSDCLTETLSWTTPSSTTTLNIACEAELDSSRALLKKAAQTILRYCRDRIRQN